MTKQLWTIKIPYRLFDPYKQESWESIKNLPEYHDGDIISHFDDQNSGDILVNVSDKSFAKEISKLFNGSTITPSIIVDAKDVHMMHYPQYLILNVETEK